ncbi:omega-amidase 2, partial [Skeletonema marinoi]
LTIDNTTSINQPDRECKEGNSRRLLQSEYPITPSVSWRLQGKESSRHQLPSYIILHSSICMWTSKRRAVVRALYVVAFPSLSANSFAFQSAVTSSRSRWLSRQHSTRSYSVSSIMMQIDNRVALLQVPVTESKSTNLKTASDYIRKAHDAGAKLTVLPEIWNSPYATSAFGDYAEMLPNVGDKLTEASNEGETSEAADNGWGQSSRLLMTLAKECNMYIVGGSIPEKCDNKIFNTCLIINPNGEVVGKHRKVHLFDIDVPGGICFKESDTLTAGDGITHFDVDGLGKIGIGICYDIRFPEFAMLLTQQYDCKILIFPEHSISQRDLHTGSYCNGHAR